MTKEEEREQEIAFLMAQVATCRQMAESRIGKDPIGEFQFKIRAEELQKRLDELVRSRVVET